jgi:hypothetical protein
MIQRVSELTGEVQDYEIQKDFIIQNETEPFYLTYIKNLASLFELKSAVEIKVLIKLCCLADFNTGKVVLSPALRKEIYEELKVSANHFTNCLGNLRTKKIIDGSQGTYKINAMMFWKGDDKTRRSMLAAGAKIKVSISIEQPDDLANSKLNS